MYRITFVPHVERDLKRLDRPVRLRILDKLEWRGMYKLRVGDYRVIYTLDPARELLIVHAVGHRREVYTL